MTDFNPLTLDVLHEFAVGPVGDETGLQHVPCETILTIGSEPWLRSADSAYMISFRSLKAAVEAADAHMRECPGGQPG